jgi:hypothetical protein
MPIRPRFLRRLAWELVVTGLVLGSVGEILVINNELLSRELPPQDNLWLSPAVGICTAMAALGLLLLVLRPLHASLPRRRIFGWARQEITRDGSKATDDLTRP